MTMKASMKPFHDSGKPEQERRCSRFDELNREIATEREGPAKGTSQTEQGKETKPKRKTKRRSQPLPREYRQEITRTAREHKKRFKALLIADPKLKDRAARFYRSLLLPKPKRRGRPAIESVTIATRLLKEYKREYPDEKPEQRWKRIYPQAIPNYEVLSGEDRKAQQLLLQERVRSRRNQQRRRARRENGGLEKDTAT